MTDHFIYNRERDVDKPKYTAIDQYGTWMQIGYKPGNSVKVDGEYFPEPNFVLQGAYYTIDGISYPGVYKEKS